MLTSLTDAYFADNEKEEKEKENKNLYCLEMTTASKAFFLSIESLSAATTLETSSWRKPPSISRSAWVGMKPVSAINDTETPLASSASA